jgi:hypothetical protein
MDGLMGNVFDGIESTRIKRFGEDLKTNISDLSNSPDYFDTSHPIKKMQVFRTLRDRHRKLVQGAFCINHWVSPLEDDEDDRLRQMIVYWQYQDVCNQEAVGKEGKNKQEKRGRETNPVPSSLARKDDRVEQDLSKVPETRSELERTPTGSFPDSAKVCFAEDSGEAHETRGSPLRSNLIVVFERSQLKFDKTRPDKSIILHELVNYIPTEYPQPIEDPIKSYVDAEAHPELFGEEPDGLKLVKTVTEKVCDKLNEHLIRNVDSYRICQTLLAEKVYRNPGDDKLPDKLWYFSRAFQNASKVSKLLEALVNNLEDQFQRQLVKKLLGEPVVERLRQSLQQMRLDITEDLQRPIAEITDYVYKSVSIRDTRNLYELNTSLWRLSWVTFVFLPLTFVAGVFRMNVDTFEHNPSI